MSLVLAVGMYAVSITGIVHRLYKQLGELRSRKLADDEQSFSLSKEEVSAIRSTNFCNNVTVSYANSGGLMIITVSYHACFECVSIVYFCCSALP